MKIFNLPDLGEGLPDAEIHEWHVKPGDKIKQDEPLVSMETAKAVVDVPSPCDGVIQKLYGQPGDIIKTAAPLVEFEGKTDAGTVVGKIPTSNETLDEASGFHTNSINQGTGIKATPAVRAMAKKLAIDLNLISPSGSDGQITINDVQQFIDNNDSDIAIHPLKGVRRTMAQSMTQAHITVVPVTITEDAIFPPDFTFADITVQIIKALIQAVAAEPNLNSWFYTNSMSMRTFTDINLGIAMDTEDGLFVPVINQIQNLSAAEIRNKINEYKKSVQTRTIDQENLKNLTITLSNFGALAGKYANPIVVPPSVAIIGIGKMRDVIAPIQNKPAICKMLPVSLTFDHRAITGGESARFLGEFITQLTTT